MPQMNNVLRKASLSIWNIDRLWQISWPKCNGTIGECLYCIPHWLLQLALLWCQQIRSPNATPSPKYSSTNYYQNQVQWADHSVLHDFNGSRYQRESSTIWWYHPWPCPSKSQGFTTTISATYMFTIYVIHMKCLRRIIEIKWRLVCHLFLRCVCFCL